MLNSELKNLDRGRRKLPLKLKLSVLICLASLVNLSGAQNDNSQINFNLNKILYPYVNVSASKELKIADSKVSENETNYCFKPQCIQTASRVLKYMDTSSDPCDNFYKFACGQFIQSQIITRQSFELRNHFKTLHSEMVQKMKNILKQELKPTEPKYVKLMKTFYQNCINTETISDNEISKLVLDSITKIDGWRYLKNNSWEDMSFQWEDFDSKLQKELKLYETPFLSLEFALDPKNNSKFFLKIKKPSKLEELTKNFNKFKNIFDELSEYDISLETVFNGIDKIKELLMNISIPENYEKLEPFKRMTVKELEKKYSNILWKKIINTNIHPFTEVRDDDIVLISDTTFFKKFNELINGVSKNDQAIYLMWGAIANILSSNDEIRKRLNNKEVCFIDLTNFFRNSFGALYVKNYYNETSNNKHIEEMFTNIFHEFQTIIKNVDWLDNKTKDNALEKLSSMYESRQILYKISTDKEIDEYYENLEITSGHYFESMLNVIKFIRHSVISVFRLPVNRSHIIFRRNSADPVATNVFRFNTVGISQGMLQGDFFNANRPMYMNYGSTAFTIAHEFAHGFDNIGRQYDKNGYLVDWLQATSNEQFISRDRCFISQYDNYTDEEFPGEEVLRVNGTRTLGDNIADNGGLKLAYLAYQKWVEDHGPELLLPEINYTQSQLFWISYAQSFCEKATYFAKWQIYHNDVHSPKEFRVIGSILNRPEFARDFQCPKGSKMNPETKCSIW